MNHEENVLVMVLDVATNRNRKKRTTEMDAACLCVFCGQEPQVRGRRGLGKKCWSRFEKKRYGMTARQRAKYEADLMAEGKLHKSRQGQRLAPGEDGFAEFANAVRG